MDEKKKKKIIKEKIITVARIFLFFLGFYLFLHYGGGLGQWQGKSFQSYSDRAYQTGRGFVLWELPEGAQDFRFICGNYGLGAYSIAAMTLAGQEYDKFISNVADIERNPEYDDELHFEGKKVSETVDYYDKYGHYIGFPTRKFEYVIDDDILDYTILYYKAYRGAGSHICTIATQPDTGRIVIHNSGSN